MFNPLMMLAVGANGVVAQRMMKRMLGGKRARRDDGPTAFAMMG
jgi:hypothetical protein